MKRFEYIFIKIGHIFKKKRYQKQGSQSYFREQMNEIKELGGCDDSGISRMHAGAILSCTLVIRQPQLITRASNICTSADGGKGGGRNRALYTNVLQFIMFRSHAGLRRRFDELFLRSEKHRENTKTSCRMPGKIFKSVIMQIETCY